MSQPLAAIVLCAGKGTRMNSDRAKVLQPLLGRPLAYYPIVRAVRLGVESVVAVVGFQADEVRAELTEQFEKEPVRYALQATQRGTGDAVAAARSSLAMFHGGVLILSGDVPLITHETLQRLVDAFRAAKTPLALLTCKQPNPRGYGRMLRGADGKVQGVVEEKDATAAQREISEVNAGLYLADSKFLWGALETLTPQNAQGELYLTDIVAKAAAVGEVITVEADPQELAGVNDRVELAARAELMRARINERHMRAGVTLLDPRSTLIEDSVEIGPDALIGPQVSLHGSCEVGAQVTIGQGSVLTHSTVGDGSEVKPYSVLEDAVVGPRCVIGPFARLRPGTVLDEAVHIGNFVETKKTRIKQGSKANHLAYLGDAEIGAGCNIGAGTITCNYDGVSKHTTVLGDRVFIGSDSQLVAPVKVGDGAFVAAGTTVTEDVPADALVLSRAQQTVKDGWAARRRKVLEGLKPKK